jgi:DNA-binding CsgD family transcriptional regulator
VAPPVNRRTQVLQEIAQCLTGLVESTNALDAANALSVFLLRLPLAWHAVDLFANDHLQKRLCSWHCSRAFAPFVTRLGFLKRPDGVYQGTFADTTLLLVKVSRGPATRDCLICGVGLEKQSPFNDGAISACVAALIHEALSRVLSFDAQARRFAVLNSLLSQADEFVGLVDADGHIVDHFPVGAPFPPEFVQARPRRRPGVQTFTTAATGRLFTVSARSLTGASPVEGRYQLLSARAHPQATPIVVDRLKNYGLSKREAQVAELVFCGTTNRRIAETLFISTDTVKTHCRRIFNKLGISRRTEFLKLISNGS